MNILIPLYQIQDYGGITGHCEYLMKGLMEKGHTVRLIMLRPKGQIYIRSFNTPNAARYKSVLPGVEVHLLSGWYGIPVVPYTSFHVYAAWADYIIWELPCPYKDEGYWREMYDNRTPQVAVIHDAHYRRAYRHLDDVADYLAMICPVNESALGCVKPFPGVVQMICNGMEIIPEEYVQSWDMKDIQAVCAHVWKRWKHMDEVVAAAPFTETPIVMGGDGIEGRYMRSIDKCKPAYKGLWKAFQDLSRHSWRGVMKPGELFALYHTSRVQIDLSYSANFNRYGCHFNRSILEAANYGCLSLVADLNMVDSKLFEVWTTHVEVEHGAPPAVLAATIDRVASMEPSHAQEMVNRCREVLKKHFDYRITCEQYLTG